LAWSVDDDPVLGIRLTSSLWGFWLLRGHLAEGSEWATALLERFRTPSTERAVALLRACAVKLRLGEQSLPLQWVDESYSIFRELGDTAGAVEGLYTRAALECLGNLASGSSVPNAQHSLAEARRAGLQPACAALTSVLGVQAYQALGEAEMRKYARRVARFHRRKS